MMKKRNITLTLQPRIMQILDALYEKGLINSRAGLVEMALFEYFVKHNLIEKELTKIKGKNK